MPDIRRSVTALLIVAAVAASVPWVLGYLVPLQGGTPVLAVAALAGYGPVVVVLVALLAAALRRWAALAAAVVLLAPQAYAMAPLYVGDGHPDPTRPHLRVMTVNLLFGGADTAQVARLVRDRHVDVLALQELSPGAVAGLERAGLRSDLPYAINHPRTGAAGTGLWSRYPLREVPSRRLTFEAAAGELRVGGSLLRVRAVHPISPVPPARWRRDLATLRAQRADDVGVLTIIVGDLNASVHHRELRRLLGGRWRDAAEAAGAGLVRTWSPGSPLPSLIDLDHVLIDRGMTATGWRSVVIRRSDHRAVLVDVALP